MSSQGHPLLGDDLNGGTLEKIERQALHCGEIRFTHPVTKEIITVKSELPKDMQDIINTLS